MTRPDQATHPSPYGHVGRDVGPVGRWVRLIMGGLIILLVVYDLFGGDHSHTFQTNVLIVVFFIGFFLAYQAGYVLVANKLKDSNPWMPTVLFVLPAMYFAVFNAFLAPYEWSFGYLVGFPSINHPISISITLYIGVSFPVQFFSKYGGCEVIAIQNLVYRKNQASYCIPMLPLDLLEKTIMDARARRHNA